MIEGQIEEIDNITINKRNYHSFFSIEKQSNWVKDEFIKSCAGCSAEFTFLLRKHHCRHCGKIFCHKCAYHWLPIPNFRSNKFIYLKDIPLDRVCQQCYQHLKVLIDNRKFYFIFMMLPLHLVDLKVLIRVSKKCRTIYNYYLHSIKNLLHHNDYDINNIIESNIIWCNRYLCSGHNQWILLLLKYLEYHNHKATNEILQILYEPQRYSCHDMGCRSGCQNTITFSQAIHYLDQYHLNNKECEKYILDRLWDADIDEYLSYFPIIVKKLSKKAGVDQVEGQSLIDYLISTSSHNYQVANLFFWLLTYQIHTQEETHFYENIRVQLISHIQEETRLHLQNSYYFLENIKQFYDAPDFGLLLESYMKTSKLDRKIDISCPLNPLILLQSINIENITIKNSYLKPIIIPFIDSQGDTYRVMIKRDDLTRDLVIMNLIKRIDKILKEDEGLDLHITTYNILPISNDFGLIEIVPDAETIYAISKRHKLSILNYILEKNAHLSINETRERFTKSCVAYCVLSYLLGIGDRHMENIMVRHTGEIFHIDFGFILGYDPKLMNPEIRLTNEMIDAMGGKSSKHYNQFKNLCTRCILCLRRHIDMFKLMLGSLQDISITPNKKLCKSYIDKFVDSKFLIGEDFNEVKLFLINKIDSKTKIYSDTLIDFCHNSITKESTKTLSNQAYNYGSSWMNYLYGKNK